MVIFSKLNHNKLHPRHQPRNTAECTNVNACVGDAQTNEHNLAGKRE